MLIQNTETFRIIRFH